MMPASDLSVSQLRGRHERWISRFVAAGGKTIQDRPNPNQEDHMSTKTIHTLTVVVDHSSRDQLKAQGTLIEILERAAAEIGETGFLEAVYATRLGRPERAPKSDPAAEAVQLQPMQQETAPAEVTPLVGGRRKAAAE